MPLLAAQLCMLLSTAAALAAPRLVGEAIDVGLKSGQYSVLLGLALGLLVVSFLRGAFALGQSYLGEVASQRLAHDLRKELYDHLQRLSFAFHDRAQTGQLMSRATEDINSLRFFVSFGFLRVSQLVILVVSIYYLLVIIDWGLALVGLATLPIVAFWALRLGLQLRPLWGDIQQRLGVLGVILQETFSGMRVVKVFGREDYQHEKFAQEARQLYEKNLEATRVQAFNMPFMSFLVTLATTLILWYGGREVIAGRLTTGELAQFVLYLLMLATSLRGLGFIAYLYSRALSSAERIFEVLDASSPVQEKPGAIVLPRVKGLVRFESVSFSYNSVSPVLRNISFEARPGEVVALVGASGSGKTTIVNLMPRFYDVTAGRITIDGFDLRDVTLASLRRNIGMVQQDVFLFSATLRDNIAYGAVGATQKQIETAARTSQIHDFITSLPQGYDTWVGERGITLSGGQKQRVAMARALLLDPQLLILDDATSSVDAETEALIRQALAALMKGRTTFIIAQRVSTVKQADQILVLQDGQIVEQGRHTELLTRGGLYRTIYELQLRPEETTLIEAPSAMAKKREDLA